MQPNPNFRVHCYIFEQRTSDSFGALLETSRIKIRMGNNGNRRVVLVPFDIKLEIEDGSEW